MAEVAEHLDLDWLERDRYIIKGLDHLGVQVVSANLYSLLLPGITNVTDRARYYSFYPWVVDRYAQTGNHTERGRTAWVNWIRRLDFAFCMASVAHEISSDTFDAAATAVVGAQTGRSSLRGADKNRLIDVRSAAELDASGKVPNKNAYFQNSEGGLGQYYKGSLRDLGIIHTTSDYQYPDFQLTSYAGLPLAKALSGDAAFKELLDVTESGKARFSELASLGERVSPSAIQAGSREETLLQNVFIANDDDLCRAQNRTSRAWRRAFIQLLLSYVRNSDFVEGALDYHFRWACLAEALPDGRPWIVPESLRSVVSAWGMYQRNELLNHALECLFWVILRLLDRGKPFTLKQITKEVAKLACGGIPASKTKLRLPAINATVSSWVDLCRRAAKINKEEPWGETSTRSWTEKLEEALEDEDEARVAGWAVRILGRIASDHGIFKKHPFEHIPQAVEMAAAHEIHLHTWLERVKTRGSDQVDKFIEQLLLEWVVFRHLRVATRKLASQNVSTFKLRPEEGLVVLAAEDIPDPTFTNPRVRQAHRILGDLHLLVLSEEGTRISADGKTLLETFS